METARKRIRRDYAPLNVFSGISVDATGAGTLRQVYDGASGEYEPDHGITPLVLLPVVEAEASDGSFAGGSQNAVLADAQWWVNGTKIGEVASWHGLYEMEESGARKGALTVSRNISPGEVCELRFTASIPDTRTGVNVKVECGPVILTCADKSGDGWTLQAEGDTLMLYDPLRDRLQRMDYRVAEGLEAEDAEARSALEGRVTSYLRRVKWSLKKGGEAWTGDWKPVVVRIAEDGGLTRLEDMDDDLVAADKEGLTMDLRLTEKTDLAVYACVTEADCGTAGTDVPVSVGNAQEEGVESTAGIMPGKNVVKNSSLRHGFTFPVNGNTSANFSISNYGDLSEYAGRMLSFSFKIDFENAVVLGQPSSTPRVVWEQTAQKPDGTTLWMDAQYIMEKGATLNGTQEVKYTILVPEGSTVRNSSSVYVQHIESGKVWIYDLQLEVSDAPTPYSPAPQDVLKSVSRVHISAERVAAPFQATILNTADIAQGETERVQTADIASGGGSVDFAESVLDMEWKTDTKAATGRTVGHGAQARFTLAETGLTESYDDYMDVYLDVEDRGAFKDCTDGTDTLTDEEGNVLIFAE